MKERNMTLVILLINLFIAFLGIGLVIPVLPTIMNELHLSGSVVVNLFSSLAFSQYVILPFVCILVYLFGGKEMILFALLFFTISKFFFGYFLRFLLLFIFRLLAG